MRIKKAIILCAGHGKRLSPLTWFIPKQLIKFKGKTIIEHQIEYLKSYGIKDIIINLHYKPESFVKKLLGKVSYSYEYKILGEEGTIEDLQGWIENEPCIVLNGDTLMDLDLDKFIKFSGGKNTKLMDGFTYAGIRIIGKDYQPYINESKSYRERVIWADVGTFKNLLKLLYAKEFSDLPKLRK